MGIKPRCQQGGLDGWGAGDEKESKGETSDSREQACEGRERKGKEKKTIMIIASIRCILWVYMEPCARVSSSGRT